ncbi:Hsp20/alpha crystallin family protein [Halosegnis marinus]|uniref:Hsp20/alpha crystallin family protein n=1 Tax=Halosegnis marinus TaxID=3034023 RepID=A0ABD5ZPY0_9EURY|nr:Hsp20/alpha crystallin family protein [Halosegnis sp. DT85]
MSTRRNPFEELEQFFDQLSRQLDDSGWRFDAPLGEHGARMAVDLLDDGDAFVVTVDLPGYERDEVDVRVTDHTLRIEAAHDEASEAATGEYIRNERRHASLQRSIRVPEEVDTDGVSARMRNGVLTVTLPKVVVAAAREVDIEDGED